MTRIREPDLEPPLLSGKGARGTGAVAVGSAHRMADGLRAAAARDAGGRGLGLADAVTALFTRTLRFDAADPHWPDRDRLLAPASSGAEALLGAALALTGHAGLHPPGLHSSGLADHPAAQAVPGPAGQALGVAVGVALAERMLAARFGRSLVDHRTWVLLTDADLAGGVSHEAASLAGHLLLDRLAVLWADTGSATCSTDQLRRFAACGWTTRRVDGRDPVALAAAMAMAERSRKPTLLACTVDADEPENEPAHPFAMPDDLAGSWLGAGARGAATRRGWKKRATRHALGAEFERVAAGRLPDGWNAALATLRPALAANGGTGAAGRQVAEALAPAVPELVGGGDGVGSLLPVGPGRFAGQAVAHGARPHGLAACTAGLALHGGLLPFAAASLCDCDALRPALRALAAAQLRVVFLLTEDEAAPDHVPALRAMPGVHVHRPADPGETAECWELALRRTDGPSVLVVSSREGATGRTDVAENRCVRGGYVLAEADGPRQATLIAGGAEVAVAMDARAGLAAAGIAVAVVSLPCWELFAQQGAAAVAQVLGDVPRVGVAPVACPGWDRWIGPDGLLVAGSPGAGITAEAVMAALRKRLPIEEEKAL